MNHTIETKIVADFENCKLHCYYDNKCVNVNYHVSTKTCEFNKDLIDGMITSSKMKMVTFTFYYEADVSSS